MSLTLKLGQRIQGDKLIEIVESSMREIDGGKVKKKKGKRHETVYVKDIDGRLIARQHEHVTKWQEKNFIEYDMSIRSEEKTDNVLLCLQRYGGYGRRNALGFASF